jgi:hypothetical protein
VGVDFDSFLTWAEGRFGKDNVIVKSGEVHVNSPWAEDTRHHLCCAPDGGKNQVESGVYRCFKTERRGTLVGLVMEFENCPYDEAWDILEGAGSLRELERRLDEFFNGKNREPEPADPTKLRLPDNSWLISQLPLDDFHRMEAAGYLEARQIPIDGFLYCTAGTYRNRIIIPYYDPAGRLIYFNARHVGKSDLRYMGPPKEVGVGKGDVLYAHRWPKPGTRVYLTEGEFDARSLNVCGLYGVACGGRYLTNKQLEMLRPYKVCMCFDTDKAGFEAQVGTNHLPDKLKDARELVRTDRVQIGNSLLRAGFTDLAFVRVPKQFKDWNKMLCDFGPEMVRAYIDRCEKRFDDGTILHLLAEKL